MNVHELVDAPDLNSILSGKAPISVSGWLVVIESNLYLIDEDFCEPYVESKKLKISDKYIAYPVRDAIYPLGGGKSFVFHRAKIVGFLEKSPFLQIRVIDLYLENDERKFVQISVEAEDIAKARKKFGECLMAEDLIKSNDWLDYC